MRNRASTLAKGVEDDPSSKGGNTVDLYQTAESPKRGKMHTE